MDKFLDVLQEKLGPIAYKLNANRYLSAIKEGFFGAMSLLIIGSMFLLLANLPIPGYADFMAGIFGADWTQLLHGPFQHDHEHHDYLRYDRDCPRFMQNV